MASYIRPALATPYRSSSPRRADRRRVDSQALASSAHGLAVERTLPAGASVRRRNRALCVPKPGSPIPEELRLRQPLGASKFVKAILDVDQDTIMVSRNGSKGTSLEAVEEEVEEEVDGRSQGSCQTRWISATCQDQGAAARPVGVSSDDMVL
jgi:hypothetical protein